MKNSWHQGLKVESIKPPPAMDDGGHQQKRVREKAIAVSMVVAACPGLLPFPEEVEIQP